jgi:arylsulfatase A-like enzyme
MVEEVDSWFGRLLDQLTLRGALNNTKVVFTGDHGKMLGAHGATGPRGSRISTRSRSEFSLPNSANSGKRVSVPVSLLDLHGTILDYLEAAGLDTSDGKSLRRFIEDSSFNRDYDESAVVSEYKYHGDVQNKRTYGHLPAFMIRKGDFKLILLRIATSPLYDMLYNVKTDTVGTCHLWRSEALREVGNLLLTPILCFFKI